MEPYVVNLNKYQGKNPLSQVTRHVLHLAVASRSEKCVVWMQKDWLQRSL